jgi:ribosome-binding protein aMBF1 (putative translation factor)
MTKKIRDAGQILDRALGRDPDFRRAVQEAREELNVAQQIYDARIKAGLTQAELARKIGSHQSAVARMEDADYDSHSLATLRKIAHALGVELTVEFKTGAAGCGKVSRKAVRSRLNK